MIMVIIYDNDITIIIITECFKNIHNAFYAFLRPHDHPVN